MKERRAYKLLLSLALSVGFGVTANGAYVSSVATPVISGPGADDLSSSTDLGFPGSFWVVNVIDWLETEEVTIQIDVTGSTDPQLNTIFITAENNTPDAWGQFEVELNQPNLISESLPAPPTFPGSLSTSLEPNKAVFSGLDVQPGSVGLISFGMMVSGDQPLAITLRPIAVPEPTSGLLASATMLALLRRRR